MVQDRTLTCRDCSQPFAFTASEQEFYAQKGFTNEPCRCPDCRARRKTEHSSSGTGRSWSSGGSYERGPRQMYAATCSQCGKKTEVPFEPTPGKPVYCADCYQAVSPRRSFGSRR